MYAIIESGGKQYQVEPGKQLRLEKLPAAKGSQVIFDKVLLVRNDDEVTLEAEKLGKIRVKGTVIEQGRAKKVIVFKFKRRKNYRRKHGHRQPYTTVRIDTIGE